MVLKLSSEVVVIVSVKVLFHAKDGNRRGLFSFDANKFVDRKNRVKS
jgi:hypothetical protein